MRIARASVRGALNPESEDESTVDYQKRLEFASKATVRAMEAYGGGAMVEQHKVLAEYRDLMKKLAGRTSSRRAHGMEADA